MKSCVNAVNCVALFCFSKFKPSYLLCGRTTLLNILTVVAAASISKGVPIIPCSSEGCTRSNFTPK